MASNHFDLSAFEWRKSNYSNGDGGECVEIGTGVPEGIVPVRDTKNGVDGDTLVFSDSAWAQFVTAVKR